MIPSEYNPARAHERTIKYDSYLRRDPLKLELRNLQESAPRDSTAARLPLEAKPRKPGNDLPVTMWSRLEATPHGSLAKIQAMDAPASYSFNTRVTVNDFNVEFGPEAVDREFPKGKRCFPDKVSPCRVWM